MIDRVGMYSTPEDSNNNKESNKLSPIREVLGGVIYEQGGKKISLVSKHEFDKVAVELNSANKKIRSLTDELDRLTKYVNGLAKQINAQSQRIDDERRRFD